MSIDKSQAIKPPPAPKYVVLLATADTVAAISAAACFVSDTMPPFFGNKKAPEGAITGLIQLALLFQLQRLTVLQCAHARERLQCGIAKRHKAL